MLFKCIYASTIIIYNNSYRWTWMFLQLMSGIACVWIPDIIQLIVFVLKRRSVTNFYWKFYLECFESIKTSLYILNFNQIIYHSFLPITRLSYNTFSMYNYILNMKKIFVHRIFILIDIMYTKYI